MSPNRFYLLLIALLIGAYTWLGVQEFSSSHVYSLCYFKTITGYSCPSCGTTRSVQLLLTGNISKALYINPLGVLAISFLVLTPIWLLLDLIRKKNSIWPAFLWTERKIKSTPFIYSVLLAVIVLNWGWNIYKGI